MFEADKNQSRPNLDKHAINENSAYWLDITRVYNENMEHYNGLEQKERAQYQNIRPWEAAKHSSAKQMDMWKKLTSRYVVVRGKSKLSGYNERDFFPYCKGRIDVLYLFDWLQIRDGIRARVARHAQMSTLEGSADSEEDPPSHESKRRRLSPVERIANLLESEHDEEVAERQSSYDSVTSASTAVQTALATLKMLKDSNASESLVHEVEQKVNVLVHRWMAEMEPK